MNFQPINMEQWHRKEYFNHYTKQQTSFSMTVDVNVKTLRDAAKQHRYQFYPAFIYAVTKAINKQQAFRMTMQDGELGYWDTSSRCIRCLMSTSIRFLTSGQGGALGHSLRFTKPMSKTCTRTAKKESCSENTDPGKRISSIDDSVGNLLIVPTSRWKRRKLSRPDCNGRTIRRTRAPTVHARFAARASRGCGWLSCRDVFH